MKWSPIVYQSHHWSLFFLKTKKKHPKGESNERCYPQHRLKFKNIQTIIKPLLKTNSSPLKMGHPKRKPIFQSSIFRCENVSFRECIINILSTHPEVIEHSHQLYQKKQPQLPKKKVRIPMFSRYRIFETTSTSEWQTSLSTRSPKKNGTRESKNPRWGYQKPLPHPGALKKIWCFPFSLVVCSKNNMQINRSIITT